MGIEIIGKLTQKNNGDFKLVDLENVDYDGTGKSAKQELEKKIEEAKNSSDTTAIKADIQTLKDNEVTLVKDETSMEGIKDKEYPTLTTQDKTLIGSINEVNSQYKDIAKEVGTETLNTTAQDLKGAINEVFQNVSNGKQLIATAITDKGINTSSDDTFQTMATNIGKINGIGNAFTVTNNLTHATNSNTKTTIEEYNSYKATITAKNGYKLNSVNITMGGTDITNTCYANGEIHIEDVIGHLVITVVAVEETSPTIILNWNFANQTAGNGNGDIQLTVNDDTLVGDYDIYYGDDNGKLSNYDKICTLSAIKDTTKSYSCFNDFQLIPKYATKLIAIKDNTTKGEFVIPISKRFTSGNYGEHLYSFGAISDIHIGANTSDTDLKASLTYLNANENVAFTCVSGDITNGGTDAQFTTYKSIKDTYSPNTEVYATNGNHEWRNSSFSDTLWETYMSNPRDYVLTHGKEVFIFIGIYGDADGKNTFSDTQKTWLETQLEKYKNTRVFLFEHYFINGTGNGNYNSLYPVNTLVYNQTHGLWLLNLLKQYKNVFLVTGHSHLKFITQELDKRITICNNVGGTETGYMLHIPSIAIPRDIIDGTSISDYLYAQSEGVVIDVYENCILYRGRNFVDEKFIPIGQFILQKTQGTLPTVNTYTITNTLSNCISSNSATSVEEGSSYSAIISASDGYAISSITVTMGGTDITSTAVNNNTISISNVTGNIVITATAEVDGINVIWTKGTKIDKTTGAESSSNAYEASNYIEVDSTKTYTIELTDTTNATKADANIFVCYYDVNRTFLSCSSNYVINQTTYSNTIPLVSNTKYIRLRGYNVLGGYFKGESIKITES
jgi:predicted phosphodiesterase